jgi:hypothetical protein
MTKKSKTTKASTLATKPAKLVQRTGARPVVKKTKPKAVVTTISALVDVGFGNALYLRGEGPGLNWEKGVLMNCAASDQWTLTLAESARPVVFKFLLNDETWCAGDDLVAEPGATVSFMPEF